MKSILALGVSGFFYHLKKQIYYPEALLNYRLQSIKPFSNHSNVGYLKSNEQICSLVLKKDECLNIVEIFGQEIKQLDTWDKESCLSKSYLHLLHSFVICFPPNINLEKAKVSDVIDLQFRPKHQFH